MGPADDALVVQLELANFSGTMAQLNQFAKAVGNLGNAGGTGGGVQGHGRNIQQHVIGPWGRAIVAYNKYLDAMRNGNRVQALDAQLQYQKANAAYQKSYGGFGGAGVVGPGGQGGTFQKLQNLIYSSRFGGVNGSGLSIQPLIGRTIQFLASLGPAGEAVAMFTAAVGGAVVAIKAMGESADEFAKTVLMAQAGRTVTGGTGAQNEFFNQLDQYMGGEGRGVQTIESLMPQLASPEAFNVGLGVPNAGRFMGQQNEAKIAMETLEKFRNATPRMAQEMERAVQGLKEMAFIRDIRPETWEKMKNQAEAMAAIIEQNEPIAQQFHETWRDLGVGLALIGNYVKSVFLGAFNSWFTRIHEMAEWMARFVPGMGGLLQDADKAAEADKKHSDAMREHSDALNLHVGAMREIFGGGTRARGAMPSHLRGMAFDQGLRGQAVKMGAFNL